jgi:tetratricopeptide (TPR) repeat protein
VRPDIIRVAGLAVSTAFAALILWMYAVSPRTVAEVTGGLASTAGLYRVDEAAFNEGLRFFRNDQFAEARLVLNRVDAARRDPVVQFYIAYSHYRQGWGRLYNDDEQFRLALEALDRAESVAPGGRVVVPDETLGAPTSDELRVELDAGLTTDLSDFNPLRALRTRK